MPTPAYKNSTFLDAYANQQASPQQFADMACNPTMATAQEVLGSLFANSCGDATVAAVDLSTPLFVTVALVLDRNDTTATSAEALLSGSWASRQEVLASDGNNAATWAAYGATPDNFNTVKTYLENNFPGAILDHRTGYISSAESRTIWLSLDASDFQSLFNSQLVTVTPAGDSVADAIPAWLGNLSLPQEISALVPGLWFEQGVRIGMPVQQVTTPKDASDAALTDGWLGIGNGNLEAYGTPAAIADNYDFPLPEIATSGIATKPIAVVENNLPQGTATLLRYFNQYREQVGLPTLTSDQFIYNPMGGSQGTAWGAESEFTLDISVLAGGAPNSTLNIYGYYYDAGPFSVFNAYQRAFFASGSAYAPVLSSSYPADSQPTKDSPFQWAWQQLFIDGALANISSHVSAGDQGSSGNIANGIDNVPNSQAAPYALAVGGTSISDLYGASNDPTLTTSDEGLQPLFQAALQSDPATLFSMVASGLKAAPSNLPYADSIKGQYATSLASMFETVWQRDQITLSGDTYYSTFGGNSTGVGGAATGVPIPPYQSAYGVDTLTGRWRGSPDVAALAGGDYRYAVLNAQWVTGDPSDELVIPNGGTSAATPLWASLTTQFNAIFNDQGLPNLGYYNDLLYIASVIAPASFNDILLGNNINSFYNATQLIEGYYYFNSNTESYMVPTGIGNAAGPGYDLATGLGTPNGELLARALTWIAHSQTYFSSSPDMLDGDGSGSWTSGAHQSLLFQTMSAVGSAVGVDLGGDNINYTSGASAAFAWTARLAGQVLQSDFDPDLVRLFDKYGQGVVVDSVADLGAAVSLSLNGISADAVQATLSNAFGFVDFMTDSGVVRVARAVAVAETAGGAQNEMAVVRVRQNGQDNVSVTFYQADDLAGSVGGLKPGNADYAAAAQAAAYQLGTGGTNLNGPGYGNYGQNLLLNVDAGDFVAMMLTNNTRGQIYWAFSQANPDGQGHLWNYGLNTWGWEDTLGGGDHDFNDLIVQLDFTSTSGNGWLI